MARILINEEWIDRTRGVSHGNSGVYETWATEPGELYRALVREYGRCISKVYIDGPDGKPRAIGWVFEKRRRYEDVPETYLQETWVTLHTEQPTRTTQHHYRVIG